MKKLLYQFEQNFLGERETDGENTNGDVVYRAEENDDIESVALEFNCPPSVIIKENALSSELRSGNLIYVKRGSFPLYRVKPSDDLNSLCSLAGKTAKELLALNETEYFYPYQLIKLK